MAGDLLYFLHRHFRAALILAGAAVLAALGLLVSRGLGLF